MYISPNKLFKNYLKLCECGCGILITIMDGHGRVRRFISGHNPKLRGEKHGNWKGGRFLDGYGYFMIYKPDHPNCDHKGYVREHRFVMEQYIGRYLTNKEEIHHINGNTQDNRIENLQLLSKSEHRSLTKIKNLDGRKCSICNKSKTNLRKTKMSGLRPNWHGNDINGFQCNSCYYSIRLRNRTTTHPTISTC